jgi:hypothetical protein
VVVAGRDAVVQQVGRLCVLARVGQGAGQGALDDLA